ncbi:MAG TPA: quinolinate synthase [Candidatus Glassbacteria bacterium]|nr:quinolinate synthase [Candidatus Glassbacteria bacterium]
MVELTLDKVKEDLYARRTPSLTPIDIEAKAPLVHEILRLKAKHEVVILGHNYMEPLVFNLSTRREQGDSLALSQYAASTEARYIIFNGVVFMAETAKVLAPDKTVLISDLNAGCSLADGFEPDEIDRLKERHPGAPVMIYINSYAAAKARCDVCCTSANAEKIARAMPGDKIIFVPDILFAENLEQDLRGVKEVIYPGRDSDTRGSVCEVHEKFTLDDLLAVRKSFEMPKSHPNRLIYAHWECRPEVLREADFYGSTSQIGRDIGRRVGEGSLERAFIASECELTSNLSGEFPGVQFATACSVRCQWMAKMTLEGILDILRRIDSGGDLSKYEVTLDDDIIRRAKKPIELMLELSR